MSQFTEKHKSDLKLQLDAIKKQIREKQPTLADAFSKRIVDALQRPASMAIDKLDAIRTSGRFSVDGDKLERRLAARSFTDEHLTKVRTATVDALRTEREKQRAALVAPKKTTGDPLVRELRHRELRDHLRTLDPLTLRVRIQQDDGTSDLLDALEGAPAGFPIAPPELLQEARTRIAETNHPELGDLAALQAAYEFAIGVTEQTILAASGLTPLEVASDPTPTPDTRQPFLASTGQPVG